MALQYFKPKARRGSLLLPHFNTSPINETYMNMETVREIETLKKNANAIKELFQVRLPLWDSHPSRYDKTGAGFNLDKRFNATEPVNIWFASWMGTYGDSSCSTQLSMDKEIFGRHLLRVLNADIPGIMLKIADSIMREATTKVDKAQKELDEVQKMLSTVQAG